MVLEGSSEALCPPPSLELRPSCNKSQPSPPLGSSSTPHDGVFPEDKEPVKYGELIVLGHNGSLANGDKGRRRSRLALYKRPKANGVKPDVIHNVSTPLVSKALSNKSQHSISYTLSRSHSVIVEYTHDTNTDMFQIGRSTESMIDFVVTDTAGSSSGQGGGAAGEGGGGGQSAQSTISRYACRIMCERSAPYTARIYAAGFDSSKNIFLGVSVLPTLGPVTTATSVQCE
ncbi:E3 ubiquitin-protein ligase pellino like 1 [Dissostichus eleginoides]|uniref:E3 ubiquitin-protein ligase pellino like 1 n=1 Tax=Dissostichus eleginoides TaxID=100907 RepID=A0AAD9BUK8_DISEL|nr:E3 ubiquitin-protein ligase pellino like 1 [Dissostichus eleginoides]